jgi:hypothetical protein
MLAMLGPIVANVKGDATPRSPHPAAGDAYERFLGAYRQAAARLRAGDRQVQFPPRCFPPALAATS